MTKAVLIGITVNLKCGRGQTVTRCRIVEDRIGLDLQIAVGSGARAGSQPKEAVELRVWPHRQQRAATRDIGSQHARLRAVQRRLSQNGQVILGQLRGGEAIQFNLIEGVEPLGAQDFA